MKRMFKIFEENPFLGVKIIVFLLLSLTFSKQLLILLGRFDPQIIKELSFFFATTYLAYIFILKEIGDKTFKDFVNISYLLLPTMIVTILLKKHENENLYHFAGTLTCFLLFLVVLVFIKGEINKRIIMEIWKNIILPCFNFSFFKRDIEESKKVTETKKHKRKNGFNYPKKYKRK